MIGHRTYLDLGRRTVPSMPTRRAIGARWHKQWSNPPALAAAARQGGDVQQAPAESPQSGAKRNAQNIVGEV